MWWVGATPPNVYLSSSCLGTYRSTGGSAATEQRPRRAEGRTPRGSFACAPPVEWPALFNDSLDGSRGLLIYPPPAQQENACPRKSALAGLRSPPCSSRRNRRSPPTGRQSLPETGAQIDARQRLADRTSGPAAASSRASRRRGSGAPAPPRRRRSPAAARPRRAAPRAIRRRSASTSSARTWPTRTRFRPTRWARPGPRSSSSASTAACARFDKATGAADGGLERRPGRLLRLASATASRRARRACATTASPAAGSSPPSTFSRHALEQPRARRRLRAAATISTGTDLDVLLLRARSRSARRRHEPLLRLPDARRRRQRPRHRRQPLRHDGRLPGHDRPRRPQEPASSRARAAISCRRRTSSRTATSPARPAAPGPTRRRASTTSPPPRRRSPGSIGVNNVLPVTNELVLRKITFSAPGRVAAVVDLGEPRRCPSPATALPLDRAAPGQHGRRRRTARRPRRPPLRREAAQRPHLDGAQHRRRRDRRRVRRGRPRRVALVRDRRDRRRARARAVGHALRLRPRRIPASTGSRRSWSRARATRPSARARPAPRSTSTRVTAGRLASDPAGTLQAPLLFTSSTTAYNPPGRPGPAAPLGRLLVHEPRSERRHDDVDDPGVLQRGRLLRRARRRSSSRRPGHARERDAAEHRVGPGLGRPSSSTGISSGARASSIRARAIPTASRPSSADGVTVNGVTYTSPTSVTLDLNTVGAPFGPRTVTITNPDGQSRTSRRAPAHARSGRPRARPSPRSRRPRATPPRRNAVHAHRDRLRRRARRSRSAASPRRASTSPGRPPRRPRRRRCRRARSTTSRSSTRTRRAATLFRGWFADFVDVPQADIFHSYVEKHLPQRHHRGLRGRKLLPRRRGHARADGGLPPQVEVRRRPTCRPPAAGVFADVACPSLFADWIEELYALGVTGGCQASPLSTAPTPRSRARRWRRSC